MVQMKVTSMCFVILYLCVSKLAFANFEENTKCADGECTTVETVCDKQCGCDGLFYFNETQNECVFNYKYYHLNITRSNATLVLFSNDRTTDMTESSLEYKLRQEAEKAFNGIMISVILFVICCCICAVTACLYCFRMHYTDYRLKKDVNALAKQLNKDGKRVKPKKKPVEPVAQSCNVIVEDAGVFVC